MKLFIFLLAIVGKVPVSATVAVDPAAIERWPDWDISAPYDGYRVYSHGAGNPIWDVVALSFYTDAKCAPSSKIALDPTTATLISSGSNNDSYLSPTSAFDESSSSYWGGRRNGEYFWLGYESGPSVVVKCIKIQGNSGGGWMQDKFTIQGKQGSGGWINMYDVEGAATASGISLLPVSTSIDYVVVSPEDAPCKDATVSDAIDCVADFARKGICDWSHWTEMFIICKLSDAKIDDYVLPIVKRSQCTWDRWTEGVYGPLYDKYLKDCSGGNGNAGGVNIEEQCLPGIEGTCEAPTKDFIEAPTKDFIEAPTKDFYYTVYSVPNFDAAQALVVAYAGFQYKEQAKVRGIDAWKLWLERNPNSPLENAIEKWRKAVNAKMDRQYQRDPQQIGELGLLHGPEGPAQGLCSHFPISFLPFTDEQFWFNFKLGTGRERPAREADRTIPHGTPIKDLTDWYIEENTHDNSAHYVVDCRGRGCPYDAYAVAGSHEMQKAIHKMFDEFSAIPLVQLTYGLHSLGINLKDHLSDPDTWVGKDGVLTKIMEDSVPGGGFVTAIFHSAAGNEKYAQRAAIKGVISGVTSVAIVLTGGAASAATTMPMKLLGNTATVVIAGAGSMTQTASLAAFSGEPVTGTIFFDGLSGSLGELPGDAGGLIGKVGDATLKANGH